MRIAINTMFVFIALLLLSSIALVVPSFAGTNDVSTFEFLERVFVTVRQMGGMDRLATVSAIITLLISSLKVSLLNKAVWSKLGEGKVFVAPLLGLIGGILSAAVAGQPITLPLVVAYVMAGGGAVFLHEILDALKALPGLGPVYLKVIDIAEEILGGADKKPEESQEKKAG